MDMHTDPDGSEVASLRVEDEPDLRDLAFLEARLYDRAGDAVSRAAA
jgi:hypothetical protein